jgi:hypothetical protein
MIWKGIKTIENHGAKRERSLSMSWGDHKEERADQ